MNNTRRLPSIIGLLLLVILLAGCAGASKTPPAATGAEPEADDPNQTLANPLAAYDPWEPFNRRMYHFNAWFDDKILLPTVRGYHKVTPRFARRGIANFFSNVGELTTLANAALQGKTYATAMTFWRFAINTTVGIGGLFDPATQLGIYKRNEDFGQTLGVYGVKSGPYLVLPFFGPSSLRDSIGLATDRYAFFASDPLFLKEHDEILATYLALSAINMRDQVNFNYYQTGSPFEYILVRYIYLNYRELEVAK